jgi:hypothetical protein
VLLSHVTLSQDKGDASCPDPQRNWTLTENSHLKVVARSSAGRTPGHGRSCPPAALAREARGGRTGGPRLAATLDGMVEGNGAVFEAKFMLPWSFSEAAAAEKHMAQLQHNMWVTNARSAALSVITGGGKWIEIAVAADPLYQHLLVTAEKKFWRCVESGEPPRLLLVEPPRVRIEAARIVDMSSSNSWAEFAGIFCRTRAAFLEHETAKAELKSLTPEDAKEAIGHGVRAKRSKSGAFSFDLMDLEASHASLQ